MAVSTSTQTQPAVTPDVEAQLRKHSRLGETLIEAFLFFCGAVSILTTVGIVFVLGRESLLFFTSGEVSIIEFFTGTRWQPAIGHFGIWALLNATLMVSG
ncbi:MAG: hypothetical protein R3264_03775, partial [Anaerolineae bacterium]|nr:hypothetical protein [Anaerolineae bacterium]